MSFHVRAPRAHLDRRRAGSHLALLASLSFTALAPAVTPVAGPEPLPRPSAPPPIEEELPPAGEDLPDGWYAVFEGAGDPAVHVETHATSAAFALDAGQSIHPRVDPAQPWEAHYLGVVTLQESGSYRFSVEVEGGEAHLWIEESGSESGPLDRFSSGAETLTEGAWLDLGALDLQVGVRFVRDPDAPEGSRARLRLLWEMALADKKGFTREPVLTRFVRVPDEVAANAARGLDERAGVALLEQKRCAACHPSGAVRVPPGPDLSDVGSRAPGAWIARWMGRPAKLRPGTDMPAVLNEPNLPSLIASYLSALRTEEHAPIEADPERASRGRTLYHSIGCVACHGALASQAEIRDDAYLSREVPDVARFPFGDLARKWNAPALASFLADPGSVHPAGRMPGFDLGEGERADLAVYLTEAWTPGEVYPPFERPERGKLAFVSGRCHACHETGEELPDVLPATPLAELDVSRGCLDPSDALTPRYDLGDWERERIEQALATLRAPSANGVPSTHVAPLERVQLRMEHGGCGNCHSRAGAEGPYEELRGYFHSAGDDVDLGDEGRIPPDLTGVGFKLSGAWLREVLHGDRRARPYMATRMPHFGSWVTDDVADDLARLEGVWPDSPGSEPEFSAERAASGRSVMGRDALGCVACHVYRDYPPPGTPGLDITGFAERLRYDWYRSFLQDPSRYEPGTRMPAFGRGGVSTLKRLYDGDLLAQVDAMWAYFSLGESMLPPEGVEPESELQVVVGERPVVLRTFLEGAGSRAIAVGASSGVHFAYDAERCVTAQIWRGEFLDAAGAWGGRGGTPAGGRGELVWQLEGESKPRLASGEAEARFRGYRLQPDGTPVFRFSLGETSVSEMHVTRAVPELGVRRTFTVVGGSGRTILLPAGPSSRLVDASGGVCALDESPESDRYWRVTPNEDRMEFTLEVLP